MLHWEKCYIGENVTGENVTGEFVTGENVLGENVIHPSKTQLLIIQITNANFSFLFSCQNLR